VWYIPDLSTSKILSYDCDITAILASELSEHLYVVSCLVSRYHLFVFMDGLYYH
jgi:hypothetical protein